MIVETTLGTALRIAALAHAHVHGIDGRRFAPGKRMADEQFPQGFSVDPSWFMHNRGYGLSRMLLPRRWVKKPPVYAAEASGWHDGHGVDTLEERRLARRNLYVSREEQSPGPPLPGSAC
jgi:hypothetical protein